MNLKAVAIFIVIVGSLLYLLHDSPRFFGYFKEKSDAQAYQRDQIMQGLEPNKKQGLSE